jgi:hypothetical protein
VCNGHVVVQHLLPVVRCKLCGPSALVVGCVVMLGTQRKLIDQITDERQQETPEGSVLWLLCAHQFCVDNAREGCHQLQHDGPCLLVLVSHCCPHHAVHITATS